MKSKINNKADCFNFIKSLEGLDASLIDEKVNSLDTISKIYLLRYCVNRRFNARKNSKKSI